MSDKFSIIQGQFLPAPASCRSCGAVGKDSIDWGFNIPWDGAVLFCLDCFRDAATLLVPEVDFEKEELKAQLTAAQGVLRSLRGNLDTVIDSSVDAIVSAGFSILPDHAGSSTLKKAGAKFS